MTCGLTPNDKDGVAVLLPLGVLKIPRVKNSNSDRRKFILSILNCFGGGVFIATGYLHLLTDSKEKMDEAIEDVLHKEVEYPFTQFVVCVGFLLVLIIENIAVSCKSADQDEVLEQIAPLHSSIRIVNSCRVSTEINVKKELQETTELIESTHLLNTDSTNDTRVITSTKRSNLHAFTMALALSVHSIFEGLALGLEEQTSQVLQVFAAIIIHKTILAFSMGLNFVTVKVALKSSIILTSIFALASPIGGAVGIALAVSDSQSVTVTALNAILLSLATGTFFYIAFIEVIGYELANVDPNYHKHRLLLILGIVLGFALFAGASFIPDD
ncbi:zinc transporter ZIP1-like isoform X2 [Dysidea avara]|uniref:zinc transporter ZIP1-like isoform X2 n=1 Tax=Dysidea avara TaxID=196820 RepID=UPI00332D3AF6